jgi:hypothetical protein
MGSKSKSKNNSTSTNAAQMAALQRQNPGATMAQMQQAQQGMQGSQLEKMFGAFNAMQEAGQAQMGQNPMAALMAEMVGSGPASDSDVRLAQDMFDMSQFDQSVGQPQVSPMAPQQMPPVKPFMHGQYIANQGQANPRGSHRRGAAGSLYDQMTGTPYAGIQKDV